MNNNCNTFGVADIVFLVDISRSMRPFVDDLQKIITTFVKQLEEKEENRAYLGDWRIRVIGYNDYIQDEVNWIIDNPFVENIDEVCAQIERLKEYRCAPESDSGKRSLFDAIYLLGNNLNSKGESLPEFSWRHLNEALRFFITFTDADSYPETSIKGAEGANVDDIITLIQDNKLRHVLFSPKTSLYDLLSEVDKTDWYDFMQERDDGVSVSLALKEFLLNGAFLDVTSCIKLCLTRNSYWD